MNKIISIKVLMDKTLRHVPNLFTKNLIKHKSVKGTKVVQRENIETFNYRRAFYTTLAISLLIGIGIGYGIFAAMNIGLTKEEVKANLMNQFNDSNDVADILERKDAHPLTYVMAKDFDDDKVYTFTGASDLLSEHDVTTNVYHVKNTTPTNVPTTVKRAYSKEDVEANYVKSVYGVELKGLVTNRERNPNTYILKKNFNEQTVYAFTDVGIETKQHPVTSDVYHVEDNLPELVPSTVQRAYSKQDIENNYVRKLKGDTLLGLETRAEVSPDTYILKDEFDSNKIYTIKGFGTNKEIFDSTSSILYKNNEEDINLPESINTRGYTKNEIEGSYIRPKGVKDLNGLKTFSALSPKVYTWNSEFELDTAYAFSGTIITKTAHIITNSLYYVTDTKPTLIPTDVNKRAYSKQDIKANYVLKSGQLNLKGIDDVPYERNELSNEHVYSFSGNGVEKAKDLHEITDNVHYVGKVKPENVPSAVTRAYTAAEVEENYVLKLDNNNIDGINALKEVDPKTYIKKKTLISNIYYESSGTGNNLRVDQLPIHNGEIYQATNKLNDNNNKNLKLELFDFKNKKYINGDSSEALYVLDNTDPHLLKFKPTNHIEKESYEIIGEGSDTNLELSDKEVLALENRLALFQKEKVTAPLDRYGFDNWRNWRWRGWDSSTCYGIAIGYYELLQIADVSLPRGVNVWSSRIRYRSHIINNLGKYKFRIFFGSNHPEHKHSFGVLLNDDGTEWDGVKNETSGKLLPAEFPSQAKTKREDYSWEIKANPDGQSINVNYLNYTNSNFNGVRDCKGAIRGVQIYKDPSYKES